MVSLFQQLSLTLRFLNFLNPDNSANRCKQCRVLALCCAGLARRVIRKRLDTSADSESFGTSTFLAQRQTCSSGGAELIEQ